MPSYFPTLLMCFASCTALVQTAAGSEVIQMVVGYCPSAFTSEGAVIDVSPATGSVLSIKKFKWPSDIFGCLFNYDPTVTVDRKSKTALFAFGADEGFVVEVDLANGRVSGKAKPSDIFFTGFINMVYEKQSAFSRGLLGLSPTVEEQGLCTDGCFKFGKMALDSGKYTGLLDVPFKAILDDSHFYDPAANKMWCQGSYDLRPEGERCAPVSSDECLIQIDTLTGKMISTKGPTNFTVYKYAGSPNANGAVLAWVEGFESTCRHPYNDFAFANVNLEAASANLVACISRNVTVHMDEWISDFSSDGSLFATGSGNTADKSLGGVRTEATAQLLVFDTKTGKTTLNSGLQGLGAKLGAYQDMFAVWAVAFTPTD